MSSETENRTFFRAAAAAVLVIAILAFGTALWSIADSAVYGDALAAGGITVRDADGSLAQDYATIILAFLLALLAATQLRRPTLRGMVLAAGGTGYLWYAYALYVIEGLYTSLYPLYLLIFGLSLWTLGALLLRLLSDRTEKVVPAGSSRIATALFLLFILLVLVPAWGVRLAALVRAHQRETAYGVLILDLTVEFPAFALTAAALLRKTRLSGTLAGIMLVKAVTVCVSWGYGEWSNIIFGRVPNLPLVFISTLLSLTSLALLLWYLRSFDKGGNRL